MNIHTDKCDSWGKGVGGGESGQRGHKWEIEREFTWALRAWIQCTDDVLLSCTLATCMVLLTNVTPINSIKN